MSQQVSRGEAQPAAADDPPAIRRLPPRAVLRWIALGSAFGPTLFFRLAGARLRFRSVDIEVGREVGATGPLPVVVLECQETCSPTLGLDPGALGGPLGLGTVEEVAHGLAHRVPDARPALPGGAGTDVAKGPLDVGVVRGQGTDDHRRSPVGVPDCRMPLRRHESIGPVDGLKLGRWRPVAIGSGPVRE